MIFPTIQLDDLIPNFRLLWTACSPQVSMSRSGESTSVSPLSAISIKNFKFTLGSSEEICKFIFVKFFDSWHENFLDIICSGSIKKWRIEVPSINSFTIFIPKPDKIVYLSSLKFFVQAFIKDGCKVGWLFYFNQKN